ncbi:hypothetical protein RJ640_008230 [Escallonia rubra]|uniref:RNase H type-1 domain-containing protein n=1 Tax=Escallonia rubra TaxID=112253 RepID=A0AA88QC21_9ASTE|nr:hypothetical protein RJ640_008230 [Escallonia rubra]
MGQALADFLANHPSDDDIKREPVVKQVNGEFKCSARGLEMYFSIASYLLTKFDDVTITHVPRLDNGSANVMAQLASGIRVSDGVDEQWMKVSKHLPLIGDRYGQLEIVNPVDTAQDDWRTPIIQFLQNPQLKIKEYLAKPSVLMPPRIGKPLKLYVSAAELPHGSLLAQENTQGFEHAIYYSCIKTSFMGKMGKWVLALIEYNLTYIPQKAVKGQALADFLANHPSDDEIENRDQKLIKDLLLTKFDDITITHVPRLDNGSANVMAPLASGLRVFDGVDEQWVKVWKHLTLIGDRYGQ